MHARCCSNLLSSAVTMQGCTSRPTAWPLSVLLVDCTITFLLAALVPIATSSTTTTVRGCSCVYVCSNLLHHHYTFPRAPFVDNGCISATSACLMQRLHACCMNVALQLVLNSISTAPVADASLACCNLLWQIQKRHPCSLCTACCYLALCMTTTKRRCDVMWGLLHRL